MWKVAIVAVAFAVSGCGGTEENPQPGDERFYVEQGDFYYQNGRWDQAHAEYVAAMGKNEKNIEAAIALIYTCRMQARSAELEISTFTGPRGDHAGKRRMEAIAWANRALEISPDDADVHYAAALALDDLSRFEESDAQLRAALDSDPRFPLAHLQRARGFWRLASRKIDASQALGVSPETAMRQRASAMENLRFAADCIDAYLKGYPERYGGRAPDGGDLLKWAGVLRDMAAHDGALTDDGKALLHLMDPDYNRAPVVREDDLPR